MIAVVAPTRFAVGLLGLVCVTVGYPVGTFAYLYSKRDAFGKSAARYAALGTWVDDDVFEQYWWYVAAVGTTSAWSRGM